MRGVVVVLGVSGVILSGCTAGSSGGASGSVGPASNGAGSAGLADGSTSCSSSSSFDYDVDSVARVADRVGIGRQATPQDALDATLTRGREPYWGGNGGTGLVGEGFPRAGWQEVSISANKATFQAPLPDGRARLTYTRVDGRWLVSHGETGGAGC